MAAVKLSKHLIRKFLDSFDTVLVDCDGVLWTGSKLIDKANETLNYLKDNGKSIFYVTNNSTKTRSQYLSRLIELGFNAEENEIATSGYLVAQYLQSIKFNKSVYLIGSPGLGEELRIHGIDHTPTGPDPMAMDVKNYVKEDLKFDEKIGAVVVGFDEYISYPKILKAVNYLSNPECLFLATNTDETFPMEIPLVVPGTGTMVTAIQTPSQRKPKVFGKPHLPMFEAISARRTLVPQRTLMIGDRCNTDINFGKNCHLQTLLVLTGVTKLEQLNHYQINEEKDYIPDYYTDSIADLLTLQE